MSEIEHLLPLLPPETRSLLDHPYALVHKDVRVASLEHLMPSPRLLKREIDLETVDSFNGYLSEWSNETSQIFACRSSLTMQAILDDHESGDIPSWCHHQAQYSCVFSPSWQAWTDNDRRRKNQLEFLEFLEDNLGDISEPAGSDLLAMVTAFREVRLATFGSTVSTHSGEFEFEMNNTRDNSKKHVKLPELLLLGVEVFKGGTAYSVKARLRYRITEGQLMLWYELVNPDRYVDDAWRDVREAVVEANPGLSVFDVRRLVK